MFSTFMGIEISKRSMQTSQSSLYVIQNNVANANNPDYARQVVSLSTFDPLFFPQISMSSAAGQIGQGSYLDAITRVKDMFIEQKIMDENSFFSNFSSIVDYIQRIDAVYNEPYGQSLMQSVNDFFNAFNDLALDPENMGKRALVREKAQYMIDMFHDKFDKLQQIQYDLNAEIESSLDKVNFTIKEIASLNEKIKKIEATGQNANDLRDQRDKLVLELSNYATISVKESDDFNVYINGQIIVQGKEYHELEAIRDNNNKGFIKIGLNGKEIFLESGKLKGLMAMRDQIVDKQLQGVNQLALSILEGVNQLHQKGKGLNGSTGQSFFNELPLSIYTSGEYDVNSDGFSDRNVIYKIIGTKSLNLTDKLMVSGQLNINGKTVIYSENDTVEDLIKKVNLANAGVNFSLNDEGMLEIKGNSSSNGIFSINHLEDSGLFLSGFSGLLSQGAVFDSSDLNGVDTLFTTNQIYVISPEKNIASWLELSSAITDDLNNIAAASASDGELKEGNGEMALKISALNKQNKFIQSSSSIGDFYNNMINDYAGFGFVAKQQMENHQILLANFENLKNSYSGVNMDEEFANMMKFQKMYEATAKFMTQLNEMYDILIGIIR